MSFEDATSNVPRQRLRVSSLDVDPIETVEVWRNPTEFTTNVSVNWSRIQIPGLPHEPKHYIGTTNPVVPIELFYIARRPGDIDEMIGVQRFFDALAYPIEGGSMPRVLIAWPRTLALICTVNGVQTDFIQFARDGRPRVMRARVEFEEIQDGPGRTYQEIRELGWSRAGSREGRAFFIRGDAT